LTAAYIVPDLAVEVLSRTTERRDRGRKMELLAGYGLREYWLIDPAGQLVETFVSTEGGRLEAAGIHGLDERFTSPTIQHLRVNIARLFAD
jgi:Uma2 family endonuclease